MAKALTVSMTQLPEQLRKTLTWDRGKELSDHAQFALATGTRVFFADPHSPWQRAASLWVVEFLVTMQESVTASLGRLKTGEHHPLDAGVEEFHRVLAEVATIR